MLVLFTDFGLQGPYVGLLKTALIRCPPNVPVIDLFHDVPAFNIQLAAYLLAGYSHDFPEKTVFLCIVDPGVGGQRDGIIVNADNCLYVGPDNGLLDRIVTRARSAEAWRINWQPQRLSASVSWA